MLTIAGLLRDYRSGAKRPAAVIQEIFGTIRAGGLQPTWISLADEAGAVARAKAIDAAAAAGRRALRRQGQHRRGRACRRPPGARRSPIRRSASRTVVARLLERRRDSDRQDQPGSVRHRPGRRALAVRRVLERLRRALHLGRLELRLRGRGGQRAVRVLAGHRHRRLGPRAGGVQQPRGLEADARPAQHRRRRAGVPVARLRVDFRRDAGRCGHGVAAWRGASMPATRSRAPGMTGAARRRGPPARSASACRATDDLEFFGDDGAEALFRAAVERLSTAGGTPVAIDFAPFREAARLLYAGPWVAERFAAVGEFLSQPHPDVHPVVRRHHPRRRPAIRGRRVSRCVSASGAEARRRAEWAQHGRPAPADGGDDLHARRRRGRSDPARTRISGTTRTSST